MNQQQLLFYLKRHLIAIVALVLGLGFGGYGFTWMGGKKEGITKAETEFTEAVDRRKILEHGQTMGGASGIKVDRVNVDAANSEVEIYEGFIKDAQKVIRLDPIAPINPEDFVVYMTSVLEELNQRARDARVGMPCDDRSICCKIIDVAVAVHIVEVGTFAPVHDDRCTAAHGFI